jgi:hypothetical protein
MDPMGGVVSDFAGVFSLLGPHHRPIASRGYTPYTTQPLPHPQRACCRPCPARGSLPCPWSQRPCDPSHPPPSHRSQRGHGTRWARQTSVVQPDEHNQCGKARAMCGSRCARVCVVRVVCLYVYEHEQRTHRHAIPAVWRSEAYVPRVSSTFAAIDR